MEYAGGWKDRVDHRIGSLLHSLSCTYFLELNELKWIVFPPFDMEYKYRLLFVGLFSFMRIISSCAAQVRRTYHFLAFF